MARTAQWFRFRTQTLIVVMTFLCAAFCVWSTWEYLPGTYFVDSNGRTHGTGKELYFYDSGDLRLIEWYRAGVMTKQRYYRPDGTVIATSVFDKQRGGVGYVLRQDGTIRIKVPYQFSHNDMEYLAHGKSISYAPDGTIIKTVEYRNGVEVVKQRPALE